jgi:hypothetical protein
MPVIERGHNPDDEPFDYRAGYDRMWQEQRDAKDALVRVATERDTALAELERLHAENAKLRKALGVCVDRLTHGALPGNDQWWDLARPLLNTR